MFPIGQKIALTFALTSDDCANCAKLYLFFRHSKMLWTKGILNDQAFLDCWRPLTVREIFPPQGRGYRS